MLRRPRPPALIFFAFLIIIIWAEYIKAKIDAPPKGIADVVYRNACCADIIIRDPKVPHGKETYDIEIDNMKFGLTGYVKGQFTADGIQNSDKETAIAFSKEGGKRVLTLPIGNDFYDFKRDESLTSSK